MAKLLYNSEDALPIALLVLEKAAQRLKLIMFKFVLKDHYPDLRGLVSTEESSKSSDQLITQLKDPFIVLLGSMFDDIQLTMIRINNVYGIDPATVVFTAGARKCTDELFWELMNGDFILEDARQAEDHYDDEEYLGNLEIFILNLVTVIDQLLKMLDGTEVDIVEAENRYGQVKFDKTKYIDKTHSFAMGLLCDLGIELLHYRDKIYDTNYRRR